MGACSSSLETAPTPTGKQTFPWNEKLLSDALAKMATAVEDAKKSELQPVKPLPTPPSEAFAAQLNEWNFDLFDVPYDDLPGLAYSALIMHPAISDPSSKLDLIKLWRFVCEIAAHYHPRPFHNFRHAVDVVLASSHLLRCIQRDHPEPFQVRSSLPASLR